MEEKLIEMPNSSSKKKMQPHLVTMVVEVKSKLPNDKHKQTNAQSGAYNLILFILPNQCQKKTFYLEIGRVQKVIY